MLDPYFEPPVSKFQESMVCSERQLFGAENLRTVWKAEQFCNPQNQHSWIVLKLFPCLQIETNGASFWSIDFFFCNKISFFCQILKKKRSNEATLGYIYILHP